MHRECWKYFNFESLAVTRRKEAASTRPPLGSTDAKYAELDTDLETGETQIEFSNFNTLILILITQL